MGNHGHQHEANDDSSHRQRSHKTIDIIIIVSQRKYAIKNTEGIYFLLKHVHGVVVKAIIVLNSD